MPPWPSSRSAGRWPSASRSVAGPARRAAPPRWTPRPTPPRIEIADAFQRFEQGDALFVDARAAGEFTYEHIPGAVNIPYTEAEARMGELPTDKDIIVYCA